MTIFELVTAEYNQHLKSHINTEWDDLTLEQKVEWAFTVGKEMAIAASEQAQLMLPTPEAEAATPVLESVEAAKDREQAFLNKIGINISQGVIVPEGVQTHFMARGH